MNNSNIYDSLKYNYVIFGSLDDYYVISYSELYDKPYAKCIMNYLDTKNTLLSTLFRVHHSNAANRWGALPFKNLWNPLIFKNCFQDNKPICFVFFARNKLCSKMVIEYLRKQYPNSRFVAFWQDLVKTVKMNDFEELREKYLDICLSFDHGDCKKYNMTYYPLVYSPYKISIESNEKSDVYFVGKAKDRLAMIIQIYEKLSEAGLICDFNITGVSKQNRVYDGKINYIDSMRYIDNLRHIQSTKCMLEIMQGGGLGFTLRYGEAIMYDKKIITNNTEIVNAPFYSSKRIHVIQKPSDIDISFPNCEPVIANYNYKEKLLPSNMLKFIDSLL